MLMTKAGETIQKNEGNARASHFQLEVARPPFLHLYRDIAVSFGRRTRVSEVEIPGAADWTDNIE